MKAEIILEPYANIYNNIVEVIRRKIEKKLSTSDIAISFADTFESIIKEHPQWASLTEQGEDKLSAEFGFRKGTEDNIVNAILQVWKNSFSAQIQKPSAREIVSIRITGVLSNLQDVLSLDEAYIQTSKERLPWLRWLMLEGGETVIQNFSIEYGVSLKNSRSGYAVMVQKGAYIAPGTGRPGNNILTEVSAKLAVTKGKFRTVLYRELVKALR